LVWDELIARTGDDFRLILTFLAFVTLACFRWLMAELASVAVGGGTFTL
jgi:hypothetical protein